ncbi:TPA: DUF4102 domain-containing protein [Escherichia coli]|nr:DUF4102 domain-containing protein [Escherichia coli]
MKLNARQIDTAKPKEKAYKLADGGGLYLLVKPSGGKYWRFKYRVAGKEKLLALGVYHAYLAYMSAHGLGKPVSLTRFGTDMPGAMAEYGKEYKRAKCTKGPDKGRVITNVLLDDDADGWLPAATGINDRT